MSIDPPSADRIKEWILFKKKYFLTGLTGRSGSLHRFRFHPETGKIIAFKNPVYPVDPV